MATLSFAAAEDITTSPLADLWRDDTTEQIETDLLRASRSIDSMCDRRLLSFELVEQHRSWGVPADEQWSGFGVAGAELQADYAARLGTRGQPAQVWLEQIPPQRADLWEGEATAVTVLQPYAAGSQPASISGQVVEFDPHRGYLRFNVGAYIEPGATIAVTYTGGYTSAPEDLTEACLLVAARRRLLMQHIVDDNSVTGRDLLEEVDRLVDPYRREPRR